MCWQHFCQKIVLRASLRWVFIHWRGIPWSGNLTLEFGSECNLLELFLDNFWEIKKYILIAIRLKIITCKKVKLGKYLFCHKKVFKISKKRKNLNWRVKGQILSFIHILKWMLSAKSTKMPPGLKALCILWVERYSEVSSEGSQIN